jgi:hypothetical protein
VGMGRSRMGASMPRYLTATHAHSLGPPPFAPSRMLGRPPRELVARIPQAPRGRRPKGRRAVSSGWSSDVAKNWSSDVAEGPLHKGRCTRAVDEGLCKSASLQDPQGPFEQRPCGGLSQGPPRATWNHRTVRAICRARRRIVRLGSPSEPEARTVRGARGRSSLEKGEAPSFERCQGQMSAAIGPGPLSKGLWEGGRTCTSQRGPPKSRHSPTCEHPTVPQEYAGGTTLDRIDQVTDWSKRRPF